MARLARRFDDAIEVAQGRLYHADYGIIRVADVTAQTSLPHQWKYYEDDVEVEDFLPFWRQPTGAHDAYALGAVVLHQDKTWRGLLSANVWEPGVYGWAEIVGAGEFLAWRQPLGAHDAYSVGAVVTHSGSRWESALDANVWEPGVYGWRKTLLDPPAVTPEYPAWVQPTGGHDAYALGARVTHNGQVWESTVSANVWEPGVYGWSVV